MAVGGGSAIRHDWRRQKGSRRVLENRPPEDTRDGRACLGRSSCVRRGQESLEEFVHGRLVARLDGHDERLLEVLECFRAIRLLDIHRPLCSRAAVPLDARPICESFCAASRAAFASDEVLERKEVGGSDVGEFCDELAVEDGLDFDLTGEVELSVVFPLLSWESSSERQSQDPGSLAREYARWCSPNRSACRRHALSHFLVIFLTGRDESQLGSWRREEPD